MGALQCTSIPRQGDLLAPDPTYILGQTKERERIRLSQLRRTRHRALAILRSCRTRHHIAYRCHRQRKHPWLRRVLCFRFRQSRRMRDCPMGLPRTNQMPSMIHNKCYTSLVGALPRKRCMVPRRAATQNTYCSAEIINSR
jgi:hypothetical protein